MTIYEGDTWEEHPYELSCQTGIITGDECNHKGLVEKEKIVLSDYKTKVSGEMEEHFAIFILFTLSASCFINVTLLRLSSTPSVYI